MTATEARRRPLLYVDLGAVAANTGAVRARTRAEVMAVVKGDGFGHGAIQVARTALAHGASSLGVTSVAEALHLRQAGIGAPLLSWLNTVDTDFAPALSAGIELAVPGLEHLRAVTAAARALGGTARIHLHADVGMARDGAPAAIWPALCAGARQAQGRGLVEVVGLMGHLGCADRPTDPHNEAARRRFGTFVTEARRTGLRPRWRHLAATAAALTSPPTHFDLVRIGAGLYGIDPTNGAASLDPPLTPALTLTAPVISAMDVPAGTPVGYGCHYVTPAATRLALLPVGYADGIPRCVTGRAEVLLRGRRRRVVGRVSMDQIVVDTGGDPVVPGEVAVVLGPGDRGEPRAAEWARWADTLEHEIATGLGAAPRLTRRHIPSGGAPSATARIPQATRT
ncbi:alanine racemase [Streptomyces gamaensis]|uniref:Alanine racemase n=1 Tax=Streptomyces gamaensis TaxID=1763542 RepID=A0ABW0YZH4_9ACTN